MKPISNLSLPLFGLSLLALAFSPSAGADRRAGAAISADTLQKQITYLASDELKGRGSGEPGNEKAAQFIAGEFERAGLKPLGTAKQRDPNAGMDGSGYYQPFQFIAGRSVGKGCRLQADLNGKWRSYRVNQEFEPSGISGGGSAEGEVVFVGFGIRAPQSSHDDYATTDVKGKIVLLMAGNPKGDPHSPLAEFASIRRKALTARDLGATAVLVILPTKSDAQGDRRFEFSDASDAGLPVLRIKHKLAEDWFRAGAGKMLNELEAQANDDKNVSMPLGIRLRLDADVKKIEKVTANVAGLLEGSDPVLKNEYVVIGAHLDHLGMGGPGSLAKSSAPAIHHGADDNASGSAGVMALAHYFAEGERPKRSLIFMCFSGEELGLFGSDFYVKHPILPLEKTVAMINMDMIGRLRDNKLIVIGSGTAKQWDELLTAVNQTAGFQMARNDDGFGASDQQSFYSKDIPVLFFFTGSHSDYHTPTDTADKINAPGEAKVLALVADCTERIANSPDRPAFEKINIPSPGGSPGFRVYFGSVPDYAAQVEGVQLNGVREGSPAAKAGLKAGDIIIKFGDTTVKGIQDYTIALGNYKPGDEVEVVVKRGSETLTLHAKLAARRE